MVVVVVAQAVVLHVDKAIVYPCCSACKRKVEVHFRQPQSSFPSSAPLPRDGGHPSQRPAAPSTGAAAAPSFQCGSCRLSFDKPHYQYRLKLKVTDQAGTIAPVVLWGYKLDKLFGGSAAQFQEYGSFLSFSLAQKQTHQWAQGERTTPTYDDLLSRSLNYFFLGRSFLFEFNLPSSPDARRREGGEEHLLRVVPLEEVRAALATSLPMDIVARNIYSTQQLPPPPHAATYHCNVLSSLKQLVQQARLHSVRSPPAPALQSMTTSTATTRKTSSSSPSLDSFSSVSTSSSFSTASATFTLPPTTNHRAASEAVTSQHTFKTPPSSPLACLRDEAFLKNFFSPNIYRK
ncbi:hypothetical protein QOT17_015597 [Balamuthia mandrillaris]